MKLVYLIIAALAFLMGSSQAKTVAVLDTNNPPTPGAKSITSFLEEQNKYKVKIIKSLSGNSLEGVDVLVLPHAYPITERDILRNWVLGGGRAFLSHDAVGSGRIFNGFDGGSAFPEISNPKLGLTGQLSPNSLMRMSPDSPLAAGIPDEKVRHSYWDHSNIVPGPEAVVHGLDVKDVSEFDANTFKSNQTRWNRYYGGAPMLVTGELGQGRVVLCGILFGVGRSNDAEIPITGAEGTLFNNSLDWLIRGKSLVQNEKLKSFAPTTENRNAVPELPTFAENSVSVETSISELPILSSSSESPSFSITLKDTSLIGKPIIIRIPADEISERGNTVSLLDKENVTQQVWPAQIESDGKKKWLIFQGIFPAKVNTVALTNETRTPGVQVFFDIQKRWAVVQTESLRLAFAVEGDTPTLQSLRAMETDWQWTWKGLERNTWTAPLLRLSPRQWPFKGYFPHFDHEIATDEPTADQPAGEFPFRVTLRVGSGTATVYASGRVELKGFFNEGMIAVDGFDFYKTEAGSIRETSSYDVPAIKEGWIWCVKEQAYALGGDLEVLPQIGESGMSPGLERLIKLRGDSLVLADSSDFAKSKPLEASGMVAIQGFAPLKVIPKANSSEGLPIKLERTAVWKNFFEFRPRTFIKPCVPLPIELYADEIDKDDLAKVANWTISSPSKRWGIAWLPGTEASKELRDQDFAAANKELDPFDEDGSAAEDGEIARRFFLTCSGDPSSFREEGELAGKDAKGNPIVTVRLQLRSLVTVPIGVFTYFPTWEEWEKRIPRSVWPRMIRDVALGNMTYLIHSTTDIKAINETEKPEGIEQRLLRYGLAWAANLQYVDVGEVKAQFDKFGKKPNIIAWYLTDETAHGKPGEKQFEESYAITNAKYDTIKELDPDRLAFNLIYPGFTPMDVAFEHLKTDIFSWDTYGFGTETIFNEAKVVETGWRIPKQKPSWITLQSVGTNYYDAVDQWFQYRNRSLAAIMAGLDGINYYEYVCWESKDLDNGWYVAMPGEKGPIATYRWFAITRASREIDEVVDLQFRTSQLPEPRRAEIEKKLDRALKTGVAGRHYQMNSMLDAVDREVSDLER